MPDWISAVLVFLKLGDFVIFICHHKSETGCLLPRHFHNRNAEFCALFLMEAEEIAVVLFADLVSGKDDDVLRISSR